MIAWFALVIFRLILKVLICFRTLVSLSCEMLLINTMKKTYTILIVLVLSCVALTSGAQTIWTGPTMTFTKTNYTDWTLEVNQDRITDNVWITRANNQGIFNIKIEGSADPCSSSNDIPGDTEWAYGTTANYDTLTYSTLGDLIGCNFANIVDGQDMVMHLITDDVYIDIKFTFWQSGNNGGGFAYERSTDQTLSLDEVALGQSIKIFPNPSADHIQVTGLKAEEAYQIFNLLGAEVKKGYVSNIKKINIQSLEKGMYVLKLKQGHMIKFIKK